MTQQERKQYLTTLLRRPIFPHERKQWLAEIEHHAKLAGVTVTIHDVNLNDSSHQTTTIAAEVPVTSTQIL